MCKTSFEVLCTNCKKKYVKIPLDAFYCIDYPDSSLCVKTPEPNPKESAEIKRLETYVRFNGKEIPAKQVDIPCPDCGNPVGLKNDILLWIICESCAKEMKENGDLVCNPFEDWDSKIAQNLYYRIDKKRLLKSE